MTLPRPTETYAAAARRGGDEAVRALLRDAIARIDWGAPAVDVAELYGTTADVLRRSARRLGVPWPALTRGAAKGSVAYERAMAARGRAETPGIPGGNENRTEK